MTMTPFMPASVAATELDPELVAELDDQTLLLALDAASAEDQVILIAEIRRRGLDI